MQVERVDFVSFLTQDIARAKIFYAETLGLEIETEGENDIEFRADQVTLDIFNRPAWGSRSRRVRPVLRSASSTLRPRALSSRRRASHSTAKPSTPGSATSPSSTIGTEMR
jgi:catechol 2,3-dioxygenase-like lactoylglutathione lyase family enzyme